MAMGDIVFVIVLMWFVIEFQLLELLSTRNVYLKHTFPINIMFIIDKDIPDSSKVHGATMGPIWGRQDPCVAPWTLL